MSYYSLQVPTSKKLVSDEEAKRLEEKRRQIDFRPSTGFLVEKPINETVDVRQVA